MDPLNDVFNLAVDYSIEGEAPAGAPVGMAKLSYALRVFNAIMGGRSN